jgi:apolipoprotein N-acyltransferase
MALAGQPELGMGWWSLLAGTLLWRVILVAGQVRAALATLLIFTPIAASGYEGLRNFSPLLWWACALLLAALYAAAPLLLGGFLKRIRPGPRGEGAAREGAARAGGPRDVALTYLLAWVAIDLLLSHAVPFPIPFPVTLGYALVQTPWVSLAALGGPAALALSWSVLTLALATLAPLVSAVEPTVGPRERIHRGLLWLMALLVTLGAALLTLMAGRTPLGSQATVQITQVPEAELVDGERLAAYLNAAQHVDHQNPIHLHVWPEAALGSDLAAQPAALQQAAQQLGGSILSGAKRQLSSGAWLNSAAAADAVGVRYVLDKRWLVPIYEAAFEPGAGERWPLFVADWRVATLICWESLFLDEARRRVRPGADVLVVLAHDGWAHGTLTPRWHALAGRLLAWSLGRPVLFASHEGPSMVWSFDGRLLAESSAGRDQLRLALAPAAHWTPPYLHLGAGWLWFCWGVAALCWGWWLRPVR